MEQPQTKATVHEVIDVTGIPGATHIFVTSDTHLAYGSSKSQAIINGVCQLEKMIRDAKIQFFDCMKKEEIQE